MSFYKDLPVEIFGPNKEIKMNNRELEALFRESSYFNEVYTTSLKHSITSNFIANAVNRFIVKNGFKASPADFDRIVNSVRDSLA